MRARLAILIALVAMVTSVMTLGSPAWSSNGLTLAQEDSGDDPGGGDSESGGTDTTDEGGETSEEGAAAETGPPWTYQMARISLVLLVLTLFGVAFAYYRFVAIRRREGF